MGIFKFFLTFSFLLLRKKIIKKPIQFQVIPQDQGFSEHDKYAGIFHFRFWFGRWIEIVVDDRIPIRKGIPIYMRYVSISTTWCDHYFKKLDQFIIEFKN